MSVQVTESVPTPRPSTAIPMAFLVAVAVEVTMSFARLALPKDWLFDGKYFVISNGVWVASSLLFTMGYADLVRRLRDGEASGARMAMLASAALLVLTLSAGLISAAFDSSRTSELMWKIQQWAYCGLTLSVAVGLIIAAGGFNRVPAPAVGLVVLAILQSPPPFLATKIYELFGRSSYRYVYLVVGLLSLGLHLYTIREAARSSARELPLESTGPFALLGSALRARVIAMFVLIAFTMFAVGGRSLGGMKVALVGAPLINAIAFMVFSVAALRASRGLDTKLQIAFAISGGAAAWCAGVLSQQVPAIYQMLGAGSGGSDSFFAERNTQIAQALPVALPLIATISVVIALLAVGAHLRQVGHHTLADSIVPRTTAFVVLMIASVLIQHYAPKAKSFSEFIIVGLLAAGAGVAALLVAARLFKSASEAAGAQALPTATLREP